MPNITLLNVDCMSFMATLKDKAFDLAIVDPVYGINGNSHRNNKSRGKLCKSKDYHSALWDQKKVDSLYFEQLFRVSENQIIFGANHFISLIPFDSSCWIVWDKQNDGTDFADCELAWTSFNTSVRRLVCKWSGMLQHDMKNKENRIHPTQKPIKLYKWLLHNYAKKGDRILDTHLGSGSSAIAAHQMDFDFVGCELDLDYYDAACKRFKEQTMQMKLL